METRLMISTELAETGRIASPKIRSSPSTPPAPTFTASSSSNSNLSGTGSSPSSFKTIGRKKSANALQRLETAAASLVSSTSHSPPQLPSSSASPISPPSTAAPGASYFASMMQSQSQQPAASSLDGISSSFRSGLPASSTDEPGISPSSYLHLPSRSIPGSGPASGPSSVLAPSPSPSPGPPGAAESSLREAFNRRIHSLSYLKAVLSGRTPWLSSIWLHPPGTSQRITSLVDAWDGERGRRRAMRNYAFALSLAPILDIATATECCRALIGLMTEVEAQGEGAPVVEKEKARVRNFFKSTVRTGRRGTVDATSAQAVSADGEEPFGPAGVGAWGTAGLGLGFGVGGNVTGDSGWLVVPNVPFPLDILQTMLTLCDVFMEVYSKLLLFLPSTLSVPSPSEPPAGTPNEFGTLSRTPSGSAAASLSAPASAASTMGMGMPSAQAGQSFQQQQQQTLHTPYQQQLNKLSASTQELMWKVDARYKKWIANLCKEIDVAARQILKEELLTMDPLMKDLGLGGGPLTGLNGSSASTTGSIRSATSSLAYDGSSGAGAGSDWGGTMSSTSASTYAGYYGSVSSNSTINSVGGHATSMSSSSSGISASTTLVSGGGGGGTGNGMGGTFGPTSAASLAFSPTLSSGGGEGGATGPSEWGERE